MAFFRAFVVNSVSGTPRTVLPLESFTTWVDMGVDSIEDLWLVLDSITTSNYALVSHNSPLPPPIQ